MSTTNEFSEEEINSVIKSLTSDEKQKVANDYKESMKTYNQLAIGSIVLGAISLIVGIIMLIVSAVGQGVDLEIALILFILGCAVLVTGMFLKSKAVVSEKSIDKVLCRSVENGLKNNIKWYVERLNQLKAQIAVPYSDFQLDKTVEIRIGQFEYMLVDDTHEEFVIKRALKYSRKYPFKEILSYKILENNISASENAAMGASIGSLFGASGAVTGALIGASETCKSMKVAITLNNLKEPQIILELIDGKMYKSSLEYDSIQKRMVEIISVIQYMQNKHKDT